MSEHYSHPSRRSFIKKTLAGAFVASQPLLLSGLIRASGTGGGTGDKYSTGTTDFYTTIPLTTDPYGMDTTCYTDWFFTDWYSSVPESTFYWYF